MENTEPYLVIYNANEHTQLVDVNYDQYRICFLEQKVFDQELCDKIITATNLDAPVIIVNAKAEFPKYWLERLLQPFVENSKLSLCSALSCHIEELSPLAKGDVFEGSVAELDGLVYLLQSASTIYSNTFNPECFVVKSNAQLTDLGKTPLLPVKIY